ncbi:MAG: hypothetical protein K0B08_06660, partial [Bacteroidales bacterium]|nr:hypothetical protein [Bacteroidales bacterium]
MWEIIRKNQQKSLLLLILMGILLVLLGYIFGIWYEPDNGGYFGITVALVLYFILLGVAFSS